MKGFTRMQHRFLNIFCRVGQAAPKVYLPCLHSHLPRHSVIARVSYTLPKTLLAECGKLGSCSACPIAIFCRIHLQLVMGQVVMLHTVHCTVGLDWSPILNEFASCNKVGTKDMCESHLADFPKQENN